MVMRGVRRAIASLDLADRAILLAVSGGIDSVALLYALHELSQPFGLKLSIGHVNHELRGEESEADDAFVRELGESLRIPVFCERGDPEPLRQGRSSRQRPTRQEAARALRYRALERMAARIGAERLATAHTADDQAETVLLRLLRGTGPDGLGGIPERSADGRLVRPLLRVSRRAIETYARERGIDWREDSSNASRRYTRNRLRMDWLPALAEEFNPQLLRALGDLAEAQQRDSEWIASQVEREARLRFTRRGDALTIDAKDWEALPDALARRLVRRALRDCGAARDVSRIHLERMLEFFRQGRADGAIELPGGLRLSRVTGGVRLAPGRVSRKDAC